MRALLDAQARNMALVQVLAQAGELTMLQAGARAARASSRSATSSARAQASGQIRADLDPGELKVLIRMIVAHVRSTTGTQGPGRRGTATSRC